MDQKQLDTLFDQHIQLGEKLIQLQHRKDRSERPFLCSVAIWFKSRKETTMQPSGRIDHKGASHQVVVNGTFCGCSTDPALAERHLQNVLARLAGNEPGTTTMTVEQFFQDHTLRDPDLPGGQRRAMKPLVFGKESVFSLAPARQQGFFSLFSYGGDRPLSARYCDIIEVSK